MDRDSKTKAAPEPIEIDVKEADGSFACELSSGWNPTPIPKHSYDALYAVDGKNLLRVLYAANNPFETIADEVANEHPNGITKTFYYDGVKVRVKVYREAV